MYMMSFIVSQIFTVELKKKYNYSLLFSTQIFVSHPPSLLLPLISGDARKKFMQGPTIKKIFYFIFKTNIKFKDKIYF